MEKRTLTVRHQLQYAGGKPVLTEPKTPRAGRTVHLPDVALTALKKHRIRQLEERLRAGDAWQDWGLVFASEVGTPCLP
ncbi:MAG TPA: hypothetical protein GX507_05865 [Clostridia bacterium]|nr:hypothetical protein [Clostridia bacterium]